MRLLVSRFGRIDHRCLLGRRCRQRAIRFRGVGARGIKRALGGEIRDRQLAKERQQHNRQQALPEAPIREKAEKEASPAIVSGSVHEPTDRRNTVEWQACRDAELYGGAVMVK